MYIGVGEEKVLSAKSPPLKSNVLLLEGREGLSAKLAVIANAVFPSRGVMARMYPASARPWRIWAYYPMRLGGLLRRYGGAVWAVFRREELHRGRSGRNCDCARTPGGAESFGSTIGK